MKLTSGTLAKYNEGIIANNRSWSVRIKYYKDGSWRTLSNAKTASLTMSDYTIDGKNITMGSVVGGKLEFKVKDISGTEFENGTKVKFDLKLDSSSVTLTSKPYVVDEMNLLKKTDGLYDGTITAYDITYLMNKTYTPTANELFANEIVEAIANKYNLGIDDSVYDAIYAVDGDDWVVYTIIPDFTEKQTLGYMAGCYGCYAYVTEDENIAFGWYTDGGKSIAKNDVYEDGATVSEASPRTYKMIESGTKETPLVYPSQAIGHSINFENPYITASQVEAIYNTKVANDKVTFSVAKVKYRGDPLNGGAGSILKARQANGQITMFVMKRTLYYDGGVYEVIESLGESKSTISYKVASPTQQRIDRALSRMEEAIKNATDVITQTKGSVFELIPIDENDPSKGNSGWKLYSTQIGNNNLILANSSGIGFSNDGGETFGAAAIYIDENGVGHINGNYITAGSISADKIDTSQLVVNKNNITGLDDELESLLAIAEGADDKADNAQSTADNASSVANSAQNTANTANTNASSAMSVANTVNGVIANWCYKNDTTVIDGNKIYTGTITAKQIASEAITADKIAAGAITADKLVVGDLTNYCTLNAVTMVNDEGVEFRYLTASEVTQANNSNVNTAWLRQKNVYPSTTAFYTSLGSWIQLETLTSLNFRFSGELYISSASSTAQTYACVLFKYVDGSTGVLVSFVSAGQITGSGYLKFDKTLTLPTSYSGKKIVAFKPVIYFRHGVNGWFGINNLSFRRSSAGDITAGKLQSIDGLTYFDLDNSTIVSTSADRKTEISEGVITASDLSASSKIKFGFENTYGLGGLLFPQNLGAIIAEVNDNNNVVEYGLLARFQHQATDFYGTLRVNNKVVTPAILDWGTYISAKSGDTISFTNSFSNTPTVIATPLQSNASNYFVNVDVTSVTKNGFSVYFENGRQSDLMWIAISQ